MDKIVKLETWGAIGSPITKVVCIELRAYKLPRFSTRFNQVQRLTPPSHDMERDAAST